MLAIRSILKANPAIIKNVAQRRNMSAICVPSRNKVSTGEMIFLSGLMVAGWSFIPCWVLYHMKYYNKSKVEE